MKTKIVTLIICGLFLTSIPALANHDGNYSNDYSTANLAYDTVSYVRDKEKYNDCANSRGECGWEKTSVVLDEVGFVLGGASAVLNAFTGF